MTLQNKIEDQMKRFDEKFPYSINHNRPELNKEIKSFLISCQQELIQEVVVIAIRCVPFNRKTSEKGVQAVFEDTTIRTLNAVELRKQIERNKGFNACREQTLKKLKDEIL